MGNYNQGEEKSGENKFWQVVERNILYMAQFQTLEISKCSLERLSSHGMGLANIQTCPSFQQKVRAKRPSIH